MKTALLFILLSLILVLTAHASGAITIEITTTDSKTAYALHKRGYGDDFKSTTPKDIGTWLRSVIPQIADPKLCIYIYTDAHTPFSEILNMLSRLKEAGAKRFVVCVGAGAYVQPELSASFDDIRIYSDSSSR